MWLSTCVTSARLVRRSVCAFALAACLGGAGCAINPRTRAEPNLSALDSFLVASPSETRSVGTFPAVDGTEIGFVAYRDPAARGRVALVYLHGIESHAGWFDTAARRLCERGYDVYCLDRRGSGINREERGFISGHVDRFDILLTDIKFFVRPLRRHYDAVFLVGLSWGGKLALGYGLAYPEDCAGLVLVTPGIRAAVDVDMLQKTRILLTHRFAPRRRIPVPIEAEMFTTTPEHLAYIRGDSLRLTEVTARFLFESHRLEQYIDQAVSRNALPVLLFLAGNDQIVDNDAVVAVLERGRQSGLEIVEYADQTHSIQLDAPERLVRDMTRWLERHGPQPPQTEE